MTSSPATRPTAGTSPLRGVLSLRQAAASAGLLAVVIALSWVLTVRQAQGMDDMAGTMGLDLLTFLLMWVPMVVAMMFPAVGPAAVFAVREGRGTRASVVGLRVCIFLMGYLLVWTAFGVVVYVVVAGLGDVVEFSARQGPWLGAGIYALAGVYQLTGFKDICRDRCRTSSCAFEMGGPPRGFWEAARVSAAHGAYCVGCCWAYMVVLIAVGMTNLVAMAGLAVVIFIERHVPRRPVAVSRVVAIALFGLAVLTPFVSWLHPGLIGGSKM